jgi:hypothetical protein
MNECEEITNTFSFLSFKKTYKDIIIHYAIMNIFLYYIKILFEVHFKIQDGTIRDGLNLLSSQCFLRALQLKKTLHEN